MYELRGKGGACCRMRFLLRDCTVLSLVTPGLGKWEEGGGLRCLLGHNMDCGLQDSEDSGNSFKFKGE
jgi:hypothetical protein